MIFTSLRYINWLLFLAVITVTAKIGSDVAGYRLKKLIPEKPKQGVALAASPLTDLLSFSPILSNALFGQATKGELTQILPNQNVKAAAQPLAPPSDLTLLGTARGSFRETFALLRKNSSSEERVFRLGDNVFSTGTLYSVGKESISIIQNGKSFKIAMPMSPESAPKPASPLPSSTGSQSPVSGVTNTGSGTFVIDQRALNSALDNIGQAMTDARLLPSMKDGKVEGFRASEVKPQGVFGMVGIKNGDIVSKINDFPIDSPEKAIQSFVTLKGQNRIKLDLIRGGSPTTFTYDIR